MPLETVLSNFATRVGQAVSLFKNQLLAKIGNTDTLPTTARDLSGAVTEVYGLATGPVLATRLQGLLDPANIPVQSAIRIYKSTALSIPALTTADQSMLSITGAAGTFNGLRLGNGEVYIYDGGDKLDEYSYTPLVDHTPEWSLVADKPTSFPSTIAEVAGLPVALNGKVDSTLIGNTEVDLVAIFDAQLV